MTEHEWLTRDDPVKMLAWWIGDPRVRGGSNPPLVHPSPRKLRLFAVACCRAIWDRLTDDAPCQRQDCYGGTIATNPYSSGPNKKCPDCSGTGRVNRSRRAVEVAERYADGLATEGELSGALRDAYFAWEGAGGITDNTRSRAAFLPWSATAPRIQGEHPGKFSDYAAELGVPQAAVLRDIVGNPFRPTSLCGVTEGITRTELVRECPNCAAILLWGSGTVPRMAQAIYDERAFERLPVLADALEEAGCDNVEIIEHLRGDGVRRCPHCNGTGCVKCVLTGKSLSGPHVRGCWALDLLLGKE